MIVLYALAAALGLVCSGWEPTCASSNNSNEASSSDSVACKPGSCTGTDDADPDRGSPHKGQHANRHDARPAQDGITRDNVTVRVDAVIYFNVADPVRVAVDVQDYTSAIGQVAQTSLRSIIGKSDLDDLLSNREHLNQGLELMIDSPALGWGVHIDRVEIKDVILPDSMKRSMSRQAEAERERRARIITADGELQASEKLAQAAEVMAEHPAALQLRLLQTVVEVAAEKNSTLVLPFPVELLRFLEKATPQPSGAQHPAALPNGETPHVETSPIPDDARGLQLDSVEGQPFRLNQ
jgi:hypothetical protein